jgi:hypothetical protein
MGDGGCGVCIGGDEGGISNVVAGGEIGVDRTVEDDDEDRDGDGDMVIDIGIDVFVCGMMGVNICAGGGI